MSIKLIACDIDDTLILPGSPPTETQWQQLGQIINNLAQQGVTFTFASGRLPYMITPLLECLDLPMTRPIVACNGALVKAGNETWSRVDFPIGELGETIRAALANEMTVLYTIDEAEYLAADNVETKQKRKQRGHYHPLRPLTEQDYSQLRVVKVNISRNERIGVHELDEVVNLESNHLALTYYGNHGLEIVSSQVSKATGVKLIAERLGFTMGNVLAIGDNGNDWELIQSAGKRLSVANATPAIKDLADYTSNQVAISGVIDGLSRLEEWC